MLLLRKPTSDTIRRFLDAQRQQDLSYRSIGATAGEPPAGYVVDHTRVKLGTGADVFAAAKAALERWQQFPAAWISTWPVNAPIREGEVLVLTVRCLGLWWLNACRIVYLIDEQAEGAKFGFAYGTLPAHAGTGEERFLVELDGQGDVWYDILAFSRPQHVLAQIGYPYVRRVQKHFGRSSAAAMQRAVETLRTSEARGETG